MIKPTSVEGGSGRSTCASRSTPVLPGCRVMFWTVLAVSAGKTNSATCLDYNDSGFGDGGDGGNGTSSTQRNGGTERRTNGGLGGLHTHAGFCRVASEGVRPTATCLQSSRRGRRGRRMQSRVMAISGHRALRPMPARPSAGPGDRPTPRGHKPRANGGSGLCPWGVGRSLAALRAAASAGSARRVSAPEATRFAAASLLRFSASLS